MYKLHPHHVCKVEAGGDTCSRRRDVAVKQLPIKSLSSEGNAAPSADEAPALQAAVLSTSSCRRSETKMIRSRPLGRRRSLWLSARLEELKA